ncbi:hypothetical protein Rhopal_002964-T1 [Rhodotorula paludigena]|uniref:Uncharacterized protein n=1 Tax=Rhodotorula paludigena TaxID=86838 RepID=A0AAV5GBR0_9BASI|nr:hypothetical protein Rhopal_002964-T1 [Rhodotorula paludigena]
MAPFPSRRGPSSGPSPASSSSSPSLLPTILSPSQSSASLHAYPPALSPAHSAPSSPTRALHRDDPRDTRQQALQRADPRALFGAMQRPAVGVTGGVGNITAESTEACTRLLEENHLHAHTFINDEGFHNHCSHHLLAAYALGASPSLLEDIYKLHHATSFKPMPQLAPVEISEHNWTEYLGDERYYPNYLAFFHRVISAPPPSSSPYAGRKSSVVPVLEHYLLGGHGQMLARAVSGAVHPLIHIGHGVEFGLDAHVAEGLAQCAVHDARVAPLFPDEWPPRPPKPSHFQSTLSSAFSSLRRPFSTSSSSASSSSPTASSAAAAAAAAPAPSYWYGAFPPASGRDSFTRTAATLARDRRYPREGLSGFTILARMGCDEALAPGVAVQHGDLPKLDAVVRNRASRVRQWCEEWRFSNEKSVEWDDPAAAASAPSSASARGGKATTTSNGTVPAWDEIVEKCEELFWMATVIYAAATRPGYKDIKLDFFTMHGLTSILFLPSLLEVISPHLRPYLLTSHFRMLVAYWVSRGRPDLYVSETLMAASPYPRPPQSATFPRKTAVRRALDKATGEQSPEPAAASDDQDGDGQGYFAESSATRTPRAEGPPIRTGGSSLERIDDGVNPWLRILQSAADHADEHVTKAVRSLYFAAQHFGASERGMYTSSLAGTDAMDGTIFLRAAGLTLDALGWAHEGDDEGRPGAWDRSALGFPHTWDDSELLPGRTWPPPAAGDNKGKGRERPSFSSMTSSGAAAQGQGRSRSGTVVASAQGRARGTHDDEEVVSFGAGDSALLSPNPSLRASPSPSSPGGEYGHYAAPPPPPPRSSRSRSSSPGVGAGGSIEGRQGWRKVGEELTPEEEEEERARAAREEEERELMA